MNPHAIEWLNLTFRWLHVIVGVAWIGASFYFVWLENHLERDKPGLDEGIGGDLWAIHGGGFYYLQKYKVAPEKLPETLHWFKWEAYATWVTGFILLIVVYYLNADSFMIDPSVAELSEWAAIGIGVGSLVVGWVVYDVLCRTPLLERPTLFLVVMFLLLSAAAFGLSQVLSARAAYYHVGAMIGTMMAGNVFFVIIPGQKKLVAAAEKGEEPDAWQGIYAGLRSRHNNYFTLPVLFIMISNHFPSTYGHEWGWAILVGLSAVSVAVRHWFNVRHESTKGWWVLPAAALAMIALAVVTSPSTDGEGSVAALEAAEPVKFEEAHAVIVSRCVSCHSANPTDDVFTIAPNGVVFDSPADIRKHAGRIKARVWDQHTMPLANKTNMTEEERLLLGAWVHQGANVE